MTDDQHDQLPMAASPAPAQVDDVTDFEPADTESTTGDGGSTTDGTESIGEPTVRSAAQKRRRGSRGGRNRKKPAGAAAGGADDNGEDFDDSEDGEPIDTLEGDGDLIEEWSSAPGLTVEPLPLVDAGPNGDGLELPKRMGEGRPSAAAAERALVRKPQIGDTRPAPGRPGTRGCSGQASAATWRPQPTRAREGRQAEARAIRAVGS